MPITFALLRSGLAIDVAEWVVSEALHLPDTRIRHLHGLSHHAPMPIDPAIRGNNGCLALEIYTDIWATVILHYLDHATLEVATGAGVPGELRFAWVETAGDLARRLRERLPARTPDGAHP